ncbi:hypothetical protein [Tardisphaera saccharovorans]
MTASKTRPGSARFPCRYLSHISEVGKREAPYAWQGNGEMAGRGTAQRELESLSLEGTGAAEAKIGGSFP